MRIRLLALLAVVAVLTVACGDADQAAGPDPVPPATDQPAPPTTQPPATTAPPATHPPEPTTPPTTEPPVPTTQAPALTAPPTSQAPPGLPGTPWDHGPEQGASLGVVGVAHDDVLNVRRGPGVDHQVVYQLDPLATKVIAIGRARQLDGGSIWLEVDAYGTTGWANLRFLSRMGHTRDVTAAVVQQLGEQPSAATMAELGRIVADAYTFGDDSGTIVLVAAPQGEHDIGEVTYDVAGFGDDSVSGARLHVFGRLSDDRQSFSLHSVEETPFCFRGVTPEGLCA